MSVMFLGGAFRNYELFGNVKKNTSEVKLDIFRTASPF